jgi:hypothetical protein
MIITLIILAFAGPPGEQPERLQREIVVGSVSECQAFIGGQVDSILISRPDVRSVAATCLVTTTGEDL